MEPSSTDGRGTPVGTVVEDTSSIPGPVVVDGGIVDRTVASDDISLVFERLEGYTTPSSRGGEASNPGPAGVNEPLSPNGGNPVMRSDAAAGSITATVSVELARTSGDQPTVIDDVDPVIPRELFTVLQDRLDTRNTVATAVSDSHGGVPSALSSTDDYEVDPEPSQGLSEAELRGALRLATRERDDARSWVCALQAEMTDLHPFVYHDATLSAASPPAATSAGW